MATTTIGTERQGNAPADQTKRAVVDLDIHEMLPSLKSLLPHLDPHWRTYIEDYRWPGVTTSLPYVTPTPGGGFRGDAYPPGGGPAGSDLGLLQRQHLDENNVEIGVCTGVMYASSMQGWPEFASALASAYNDWTIETFLEQESRLRGSIQVAHQDPVTAAKEIDRLAEHPQIVQVFVHTVSEGHKAIGDPFYRPILEAISRHDLVLAMHQGQATKTVYGYPRTFAEWHMGHPHATMCQLYSLMFNGAFDQFPNLRVCMLESGFTWLPHALWRMDEHYHAFRAETPWLKRLPSDHVRDHLLVATQPREDVSGKHLEYLIDMMGSDRLIAYSSDYPHYDFDAPGYVLPVDTSEDLKHKILYQNAHDFYRFGA